MILVDTSVWVEHLRRGSIELIRLLETGEVLCHPFVIGELACGRLAQRGEILSLLRNLPQAPVALHHEVLAFVEARNLFGSGIGWIDAHLLVAAALGRVSLWTLGRRLSDAVRSLNLAPAF